jgi:hypothetical protein
MAAESKRERSWRRVFELARDYGCRWRAELALHLIDFLGLRPSAANLEVTSKHVAPVCGRCDAWLRRQLEGLAK